MNHVFHGFALGLLVTSASAQCLNAPGTVIADFTQADFILPAQPIGFAFPFNGATYTDLHISDHGIVFLSNGGVPAPPVATPFVYNVLLSTFNQSGPVIAPFWADHTLGSAGEIFLDNTSGSTCTITWKNAQTYLQQLPQFSFQMRLSISGDIVFAYDADAANYGSTFAPNAIVGVSPGGLAALPSSSDLSSGPITADPTLFEEFATPSSSDVAAAEFLLIPTNPGWVVLAGAAALGPCASHLVYGAGCYGNTGDTAFYEELPAAGFDLAAGTTITLLRQPNGYVALDSLPGTFVTPTPAAINIAAGFLDGQQTVALSSPMPVDGGVTSNLTICTKGYISLSANSNGIDYTPTAAEFLAFPEQTIAPMWHDWNQTIAGSGLILFEEIGGIAYATWNGVYSFAGTNQPDTFQVQFNLTTGDITIVYTQISNDGPNYLVGYKARGAGAAAGPIDVSTALAATVFTQDLLVPLSLDCNDPVLGSNWSLTTTNIDPISPIAITFFGLAVVNPGLDLGFLGAGGCNAHIQPIVGDLTGISVGGSATVSLPIPATASLAGSIVTAQSICLTLVNSLNLLTSNGVEGTLGN